MNRLSHDEALGFIESWLRFPVQEMSVDVLRAALQSCKRFQLSYWDAAVIEAARAMGCREVLSEDLSDSQDYAGIRVLNPFAKRRSRSRRKR
jgi:predicted nucleic acid-binding protein